MIVQVLNSGIVSGPETLVLPAMPLFKEPSVAVFLVENRWGKAGLVAFEYACKLGVRAEKVVVNSRIDFGAVKCLNAVLTSLAPKVVHAHDVKASTYTWLASRGAEWKCVSTHHGVEGRPDWKTKIYEYFYSHVVLPRMDMAITVSRDDEQILLQRGLNSEHVQYVANGITRKAWNGEEKAAERNKIRSQWNRELGPFPEGVSFIGIVARLSPEKRHSYFFRTLVSLRQQRPELQWRFLIFGTGKLEAALRREADKLGLAPFCIWMGYRENAAALLPGLDILVLSSSAEGLPITALEAGWAGVPMFASNVGGLPEIVGTGSKAGGVIFPKEQEPAQTSKSLAWLLENPAERERFGQQLQKRVARDYSAQAFINRTEAIYHTI